MQNVARETIKQIKQNVSYETIKQGGYKNNELSSVLQKRH